MALDNKNPKYQKFIFLHTGKFTIHYVIAPKEHLRLTGMMFARTCVRACGRTLRWKILFTPYLVVEVSPSAEIWCVYVTSINDGTQILTFLGIHNSRYFQNSRFLCGNLIILNLSCIAFYFQIDCNCCIHFPNYSLIAKYKGISQ